MTVAVVAGGIEEELMSWTAHRDGLRLSRFELYHTEIGRLTVIKGRRGENIYLILGRCAKVNGDLHRQTT